MIEQDKVRVFVRRGDSNYRLLVGQTFVAEGTTDDGTQGEIFDVDAACLARFEGNRELTAVSFVDENWKHVPKYRSSSIQLWIYSN